MLPWVKWLSDLTANPTFVKPHEKFSSAKNFFRENQTQRKPNPTQQQPPPGGFLLRLKLSFPFVLPNPPDVSVAAGAAGSRLFCSRSHPGAPSPPAWSCSGGDTAVTSHPSPACSLHFPGEIWGIFLDTLAGFPPLWGAVGCVSSSLCSWTQTLLDLKTAGVSCLCVFCPLSLPSVLPSPQEPLKLHFGINFWRILLRAEQQDVL